MIKGIQKIKEEIVPILKEAGVLKSALFGSIVRNESHIDSDIDILIETSKPVSIFVILRMEKELGLITKRKIDIVEYSAIKQSIKQNILREAIPLL